MTRDETITILRNHADEIKARGVMHLGLFGSLARGEARPDSDVDVVVEIVPGHKFSLIDHASLRVMLCDILESEADVVVANNMRSPIKERIERDRMEVF